MKRLAAVAGIILIMSRGLGHAGSAGPDPPVWTSPSAMAIKRVSPVNGAQNEPNFLNNLDCSLAEYRLPASHTMQTGCFSPTAFGLIDSDSGTVIYNGTDEGLPLLPFLPSQILAPWPEAGNLVSLSPALVNGSYISLYKNPLGALWEQRNLLGQLVSKQLSIAPELRLLDPAGQPLVINPQTLAFSDGGSWLVAEDLNGSFVRVNLASLDVLPFASSYIGRNGYDLLKSQVAVSHDGRYIAINNEAAGEFKVYDLAACSGTVTGLAPLRCQANDYRSYIAGQVGGLRSIRHVRFINDGLVSFEANSGDSGKSGIYELAPTAKITSLIDYLGLGDSYTSGEGAFDYLSGTDSADNVCHLSVHSYPLLLARDLFSAQSGHSVACSGAVINDIASTSDNYRGQVKNAPAFKQLEQGQALLNSVTTNFIPGYVAQQRFVSQYQPGATTVSIGGNDIGFGDIVQTCVAPQISLHSKANTCFSSYEDRQEVERLIDRTIPRWTALYKQLRAEAPSSQFFAIGYPQIAWAGGNCALNVHLNHDELEFTSELVDYLNAAITQAANKAGVPYVDIRLALAGHRLCETASYNVAVNGLTAGNDSGAFGAMVLGHESYHPNALGHELIEQAILRQTHNLQITKPSSGGPPDPTRLSNAPKTGRPVHARSPEPDLTSRVTKSGKANPVKIRGSKNGLKPKATYKVHLDGPAGTVIGSVTSNDSGDIDGTVTIPPGTPGGHTIDISGDGQGDDPVDVTQPIYVPANDDDNDGDGLPNGSDSCPYAANSGVDSDRDGIDDSCDPLIGQPPAPDNTNKNGTNGRSGSGSTNDNTMPPPSGVTLGNPAVTVAANHTPATAKSGYQGLPALSRLPSLNWLLWLLLPALLWMLILLAGLVKSRVNKNMYPK